MRAVARRAGNGYTHRVQLGRHELTADEPAANSGEDRGPNPQELLAASLASCVAITVEMYAARKEWDLGEVEVSCSYELPDRGQAASYRVEVTIPRPCSAEQLERLRVIAGKCPVHRLLEGEATFEERVVTSASSAP